MASPVVWTVKVWLDTPGAKVSVPLAAVKSPASAESPLAMEVAKSTVWLASASPVRVTVKVTRPPSLMDTSPTLKAVRSSSGVCGPLPSGSGPVPSSTMVPTAVASLMVEPVLLLLSVTVKVSAPS